MGRFIFVSFGLLVVFLSLSGTAADCPPDWSSYEGSCYRVFQQKMNWEDAERLCEQQYKKSHLVSFHSSEEVDFVMTLTYPILKYDFVWIGLSNIWKQCSSNWSDGSCVCYENLVGQNVKKCFVLKRKQGFRKWSNVYCGQQYAFMCKFLRPR